MSRQSVWEPRKVFYQGRWYEFPTYAERDEFIRDMNEADLQTYTQRSSDYIA